MKGQRGGAIFTKSLKKKFRGYRKKTNDFRRDNIIRFGRKRTKKGKNVTMQKGGMFGALLASGLLTQLASKIL